jgi:surface antigen
VALALVLVACSSARRALGPIVTGYPYAARCPRAGIGDIVDRWGMSMCNCTSYVARALQANGQRIEWFIPGPMNAWNSQHVARLDGLRVDRAPSVGSVAAWPQLANPLGHVAYAIGVRGPGLIAVADYNLPGSGDSQTFVFDTSTDVSAAGVMFIHVPRRARG